VLLATSLALGSAVLHAGWNLAVKSTPGDRYTFIWAMMLWGALASLPALAVLGWPGVQVLPYAAASAVIHVAYGWFLARAYDLGDFGVAYPVARGGGAFLAAVGGVALLSDDLSLVAGLGASVVLVGLLSLARLRSSGRALAAALATAALIAAYTLTDAAGSRAADSAGYGAVLQVFAGAGMTFFGCASGRLPAFRTMALDWRIALAGCAGAAAYIAVLVAVRHAPVGYVACLRETSVVLGAAGGWLLLKEPMARARLMSAAIVALGVALLVVGR
jgi:drug/metabolite transporter (DMT)-like permease